MPDPVAQFTLSAGLDGKSDARTSPLGTPARLQNCVWNKLGAVEKRPGHAAQGRSVIPPTDTTYTAGVLPISLPAAGAPSGMFTLGSEQVTVIGNRIYAYSPTVGAQVSKDEIPEAVGTRRSLSSDSTAGSQYSSADVCQTSNGYRVYAWVDGNVTVHLRAYDVATGAVVFYTTLPTTAGTFVVKVVAVGTYVVVLTNENPGGLYGRVVYTQNIPTGANVVSATVTTLTPNLSTSYPVFDACSNPSGTALYVAFGETSAVAVLYCPSVPSLTVAQSGSFGTALTRAVGICDNAGTVYIAYTQGSSGTINVYGAADTSPGSSSFTFNAATFNSTPARLAVAPFTSTETVVMGDGITGYGVQAVGVTSAGAVSGHLSDGAANISNDTPVLTKLLYMGGKPIAFGGRMYCLLYYASTSQPTFVWCDIEIVRPVTLGASAPRPVAVIAPRISSFIIQNNQPVANTITDGSTSLWAPCSVLEGGGVVARTGNANVAQNRLWETQLNFAHPSRAIAAPLGKSILVGSSVYDGSSVSELGFVVYPEGAVATPSAGGGLTASATYQYMLVWGWITTSGELIYSTYCQTAGTQALSVTLSGSQGTVALSNIPGPAFTAKYDAENKSSPIQLFIFRTSGLAGTTFNLVATQPAGISTYTDTASDASIASNPLLYFTPGFPGTVLDYVCPPSSSFTFTAQNRPWLLGDDLRTWWFGNYAVEGQQSQFNEGLTLVLPEDGVAGGALDEKIVFFSKNSIFFTAGDGPSTTGSGNTYPTPARIQSDVGCIDPRSVCSIPDGLLFLSAKGWCVLGRDLTVHYLTAPADIVAQYPNVTSAVCFPARSEVRIAMNNGTTGIVLVASYWNCMPYMYRWSWFVLYDGVAAVSSCIVNGAAMVNGAYRWISSAGSPYTEDTTGTNYWDGTPAAASWVTMWVEGTEMHTDGPVGWYRAKRLAFSGNWYSMHDLTIGVAMDYTQTYSGSGYAITATTQSRTILSTSSDGVSLESGRLHIKKQKCSAFRWSIADAFPSTESTAVLSTSGRGFSLAALEFSYMPKPSIGKQLGQGRSV